jgi:hypothetical protein
MAGVLMAFLAAAAPYIAAASTVIGAAGAIKQGQDANAQAQAQALALRNQANADQAAAERTAIETRRQASYLVSRGQALAAASGAGATDPTVVSVLGQIKGEGEYGALTQLYEGDTAAGNARSGAQASINEGRAAASAGNLRALTTVLSGAGNIGSRSLATKYQ